MRKHVHYDKQHYPVN